MGTFSMVGFGTEVSCPGSQLSTLSRSKPSRSESGAGLYTLHVGLWDARSQKPVWQATTDSATTGSDTGDLEALADFIVDELREKKLISQE